MDKEIKNLSNHYILCGLGETGRCVAEEFIKTKRDFVAIELDEERIKKAEELLPLLYIHGDATQDSILINAGIERATGLVSTLALDRDNLFVVLTARGLNPNLRIVTRAIESQSGKKLMRAGADSVVSPNFIGGLRMASAMIRPTVVDFLDIMLQERGGVLRIEEIRISKKSKPIGQSLGEAEIRKRRGVVVVAIKDGLTGEYSYAPEAVIPLKEDDILIVLGEINKIDDLKRIA